MVLTLKQITLVIFLATCTSAFCEDVPVLLSDIQRELNRVQINLEVLQKNIEETRIDLTLFPMESEVEKMISEYETAYAERKKQSSETLASQLKEASHQLNTIATALEEDAETLTGNSREITRKRIVLANTLCQEWRRLIKKCKLSAEADADSLAVLTKNYHLSLRLIILKYKVNLTTRSLPNDPPPLIILINDSQKRFDRVSKTSRVSDNELALEALNHHFAKRTLGIYADTPDLEDFLTLSKDAEPFLKDLEARFLPEATLPLYRVPEKLPEIQVTKKLSAPVNTTKEVSNTKNRNIGHLLVPESCFQFYNFTALENGSIAVFLKTSMNELPIGIMDQVVSLSCKNQHLAILARSFERSPHTTFNFSKSKLASHVYETNNEIRSQAPIAMIFHGQQLVYIVSQNLEAEGFTSILMTTTSQNKTSVILKTAHHSFVKHTGFLD